MLSLSDDCGSGMVHSSGTYVGVKGAKLGRFLFFQLFGYRQQRPGTGRKEKIRTRLISQSINKTLDIARIKTLDIARIGNEEPVEPSADEACKFSPGLENSTFKDAIDFPSQVLTPLNLQY